MHVCVSLCLSVCQSLACPRDNLGPVEAKVTKLWARYAKHLGYGPYGFLDWLTLTFKVKCNWKIPNLLHFELVRTITHNPFKLESPILDNDIIFKRQIWLQKSIFRFHCCWNNTATTKQPETHDCLDCFTGLTVSWSQSSACTYIPKLFHSPNTLHVHWSWQPRVFRRLTSPLSALSKRALVIEYHFYIWKLTCGDTCQIWMWFKESKWYFRKIENFANGEIDEQIFSNPTPK